MRQPVQLPKHARIRPVVPHQLNVRVKIEWPVKSRKRIAVPFDRFLAETLFAESQKGPTMIIYDSVRGLDQSCSFIRKKLLLQGARTGTDLEAGKEPRFQARSKMRQQIGRANSRKLFAQTRRLVVERCQT